MKATGIVRRIDDLGRVVIPKEIRRTMRIREGDPLEIYTNPQGEVIFKKYSPVENFLQLAQTYGDVLTADSQRPVIVCDKDHVICVSGAKKKELIERRITGEMESALTRREAFLPAPFQMIEGVDKLAVAVAPVLVAGDVIGAFVYLQGEKKSEQVDLAPLALAAKLLAGQMEE